MACRNHPEVESGLQHCHRCGYRFCDDCRVEHERRPHCAACAAEATVMSAPPPLPGHEEQAADLPPWERREQIGFSAALFGTLGRVLTDPADFFRRMAKSDAGWDALAIPCLIWFVTAIPAAILNYIVLPDQLAELAEELAKHEGGQEMREAILMLTPTPLTSVMGIVMAPAYAVVAAFLLAGSIHVVLMMSGKAQATFQQTFRGWCYASAPMALAVVPMLGSFVGFLWLTYASVVMAKEVHKTSWGIAALSALWLPLAFLCCGACGSVSIAAALVQGP